MNCVVWHMEGRMSEKNTRELIKKITGFRLTDAILCARAWWGKFIGSLLLGLGFLIQISTCHWQGDLTII
jgi:hypothetical protein